MLKRLKIINLMVIASLMLVFSFGSFDKAKAQTACPGVPFQTGWLDINVSTLSDFTAGLLGTFEGQGGGIDWLYANNTFFPFLPTEFPGSQLVSWWNQVGARNTFIQVTNQAPVDVDLHVVILDSDCLELRDFCDTLTGNDTHVYNFGDLFSNLGQDIPDANFQEDEGVVFITAVESFDCRNSAAIGFNFLEGNLRLIDGSRDIDYGTNLFARFALADTFQTLDGANAAFLDVLVGPPTELTQNFSLVGAGAPGADLVLISTNDDYGVSPDFIYDPIPGLASYNPGLFDANEDFVSCGDFSACFARIGIDDAIPLSDGVVPPTPPPTVVPCTSDDACDDGQECVGEVAGACSVTTATACFDDTECLTGETCEGETIGTCQDIAPTDSPTPTPPDGGGGSSSSGCAIAGPVSLGTAMANILLPLVPVAFAFGLGALRRRNRKENK